MAPALKSTIYLPFWNTDIARLTACYGSYIIFGPTIVGVTQLEGCHNGTYFYLTSEVDYRHSCHSLSNYSYVFTRFQRRQLLAISKNLHQPLFSKYSLIDITCIVRNRYFDYDINDYVFYRSFQPEFFFINLEKRFFL